MQEPAKVVPFEKFFYSRNEAASSLAVSVRSIDYLISYGKLRTRRKGRRVLIPSEDVKRLAAEIMRSDMPTKP
jgi:excisionase family DNA binding protein